MRELEDKVDLRIAKEHAHLWCKRTSGAQWLNACGVDAASSRRCRLKQANRAVRSMGLSLDDFSVNNVLSLSVCSSCSDCTEVICCSILALPFTSWLAL